MRNLLVTTLAPTTALLLAALLLAAPAQARTLRGVSYVALGDSAVAGPGLPLTDPTGVACARSTLDYPHEVARDLGAALVDVSCSGATLADLTGGQVTVLGRLAPQLDAVTPSTTGVTIQVGANDVGLLAVAQSCVNVLPAPLGSSCAARLTVDGDDVVSDRIAALAPRLGELARQVRARAPRAVVVFVGYGDYLRPGGCFPVQPFWSTDADFLQAKVDELNAVTAAQARASGALFVDPGPAGVGHDACAAPDQRWFQGVVPVGPGVPLHPTVLGMAGIGDVIAAAVRAR